MLQHMPLPTGPVASCGANNFRVASTGDAFEVHGTGPVAGVGSWRFSKDVARATSRNNADTADVDLIQKETATDDVKVGDGATQAAVGNGFFELYDAPGAPGAPTEDAGRLYYRDEGKLWSVDKACNRTQLTY